MKKATKFLAWALATSMVVTAVPATAAPIFAKEATSLDAVKSSDDYDDYYDDDNYDYFVGFYLQLNKTSVNLMKGQKATVKCTPRFYNQKDKSDVTYKWQYYDSSADEYKDIEGANSASYEIQDAGRQRTYRVIATEAKGHTTMQYIYANHKSSIDCSSTKRTYDVKYGRTVAMKINAVEKLEGESIVSYQWYQGSKKIKNATTDTYTTTADSEKTFRCRVKASTGETEDIIIDVNPTSEIKIEDGKTSYNVVSGGSQTLSVTASTKQTDAVLSYQWSILNKDTGKYDDIDGANSNTYTASNITEDTTVKCTVSSTYDNLEESKEILFSLDVTKFGLNMTNDINEGYTNYIYVPVNKPVKFSITGNGTIKCSMEQYGSKSYKSEEFEGNEYTVTNDKTGYTRLYASVYDEENHTSESVYGNVYAFNNVGDLTAGNAVSVTIPKMNEYTGYAFKPAQTGQYSIRTDKEESFWVVNDKGVSEGYTTSKDADSETVYKETFTLEANKQYYIVVSNSQILDEESGIYKSAEGEQFSLTLSNDVNCAHLNTNTVNAVAATCTTAGYTGDEYCDDCEVLLAQGTTVAATGHRPEVRNAVAATCTTAGYTGDTVCTVCGYTVPGTAIAPTGHNPQIVNAKPATFKEDGYTGDSVCATCGTVVTPGTAIAKIKSVTVKRSTYTYTGKNIKTAVVVKDSKGKTINASNYKVTYSKNLKSVGVKNIKVTFTGNYSGTKTVKYTVVPKNTNKLAVASKSGKLNIKWNKQLKETTGYQIQYSTKKNFKGAKTVTIKKNKTTKTTIKSLKKGTTYYVRIRTYKVVNKKNIASNWSSTKTVKIK